MIVDDIKANGGVAKFYQTDVMNVEIVQQNCTDILKDFGRVIINFSSIESFLPMTRVCGYAAAKAGISNFTAYMAHETAKKFGEGIRVNAIAPGFFITEQNRALLTNPDGSYTERGKDVVRQTHSAAWVAQRSFVEPSNI